MSEGIITPAQKYFYTSLAMADSIQSNDDGLKKYEYEENNEKKTVEFSDTFELVQKVLDNSGKQVDFEEKSEEGKKEEKKSYTKDEVN